MSKHRSTVARLLITFAVCLVFCAVLFAEVPELMSLTDNVSNDFTIHKTGNREFAKALNAASHIHFLRDAERFERATSASFVANPETPASPLFLLGSVLRT